MDDYNTDELIERFETLVKQFGLHRDIYGRLVYGRKGFILANHPSDAERPRLDMLTALFKAIKAKDSATSERVLERYRADGLVA